MAEISGIGWLARRAPDGTLTPGATFNGWIGCTKVSDGCDHCYAEAQNKHYQWNQAGWGKGQPRKRTSPANWKAPFSWARKAKATGRPIRIFAGSLMDFLDSEVPPEWRSDLFSLINQTAQIAGPELVEWVMLTKRIELAHVLLPADWILEPPAYVRLGVTVENQARADQRIHKLLKVWSGKNFVSYEPALGPLDLTHDLDGYKGNEIYGPHIHWLACGGESGAGCREMPIEWALSVLDQCKEAGVPFFFKQLGGFPDKRHDPAGWPEELRVQELPEEI